VADDRPLDECEPRLNLELSRGESPDRAEGDEREIERQPVHRLRMRDERVEGVVERDRRERVDDLRPDVHPREERPERDEDHGEAGIDEEAARALPGHRRDRSNPEDDGVDRQTEDEHRRLMSTPVSVLEYERDEQRTERPGDAVADRPRSEM